MTREQRKLRITEQKALGVVEGDWIIFGSSKFPLQAKKCHLDPRTLGFLRWHKATQEQIDAMRAYAAEREQERLRREQRDNLPENKLASRLASTQEETWKALGICNMTYVVALLDAIR